MKTSLFQRYLASIQGDAKKVEQASKLTKRGFNKAMRKRKKQAWRNEMAGVRHFGTFRPCKPL